jgi:NADH-quinone oxidoreductase subunit A
VVAVSLVDTAFFYPWAVILRDGGAAPFWAMMPFLALLVLGDIYLWKKGAFDW